MQIRSNPRQHEFRGRQRLDSRDERTLKKAAKTAEEKSTKSAESADKSTSGDTTTITTPSQAQSPRHRVYRLFDRHSGQANNKTQRKSGAGKGGWGAMTDTMDEDTYYEEFYGDRRPFQNMQVCKGWQPSLTLEEYFKARGMSFTSTEGVPDKTQYALPRNSDVFGHPLQRRRSSRTRRASGGRSVTLVVQSAGRSPTTEGGQRDTHLPWIGGKKVPVDLSEVHPIEKLHPVEV